MKNAIIRSILQSSKRLNMLSNKGLYKRVINDKHVPKDTPYVAVSTWTNDGMVWKV